MMSGRASTIRRSTAARASAYRNVFGLMSIICPSRLRTRDIWRLERLGIGRLSSVTFFPRRRSGRGPGRRRSDRLILRLTSHEGSVGRLDGPRGLGLVLVNPAEECRKTLGAEIGLGPAAS